ncbi:MAG: carbon-nitrogen hydrolase family protein [Mycobacteriaceae bacterium]
MGVASVGGGTRTGRHAQGGAGKPSSSNKLVVAAAQIAPAAGQIHQNALAVSQYIRAATARGARLVLFPELCLGGYDLALLAEAGTWTVEGDVRLETTREACAEPGVHAVVGTAHVAGGGRRLLASVMVHPDGSEVVQGKQHLHGRETDWFTADRSPTRLFVVDEWRVALAVCYDAAVPSHAEAAGTSGADISAVSALYAAGQERRLQAHMAARAKDNRMHVILANLAGDGPGWTSCGLIVTWRPDGSSSRSLDAGEGLLVDTLTRIHRRLVTAGQLRGCRPAVTQNRLQPQTQAPGPRGRRTRPEGVPSKPTGSRPLPVKRLQPGAARAADLLRVVPAPGKWRGVGPTFPIESAPSQA